MRVKNNNYVFKYAENDLVTVIKEVIMNNLGLSIVNENASFSQDLNIDEPTRIEILLAIEYAVGVKFNDEKLLNVDSIKDVVELYRFLLKEGQMEILRNAKIMPFGSSM